MAHIDNFPQKTAQSGAIGMHPMLIVAAGAVTVFCAVGIGVMTGIIPSAQGQKSETTTNAATAPSTPMTPVAATAAVGSASEAALPEAKPAESKPVATPPDKADKPAVAHKTTKPAHAAANAPTPVYVQGAKNAADMQPTRLAANEPPPVCRNCGTIDSITPITKPGEGSGAGAVLGGVLGGVLGHQVGNGRGKDLATVAGAVGGAFAGNAVEKNAKTSSSFDVRVRLEDGTFQTLRYETDPGLRVGDKVKIEHGKAVRS